MDWDTIDLGTLGYAPALATQRDRVAAVAAGHAGPALLLVEHPPTITVSRRPEAASHVLAGPEVIARRGVVVEATDRGGDVTFHGPGQLVVYPVVRLRDTGLTLTGYLRALEAAVAAVARGLGIDPRSDPEATGVWADSPRGLAKLCAMGVRLRRGVTMHGLALNVTTDLSGFELIDPCGLGGRPVTSLLELLGDRTPPMDAVKQAAVEQLQLRLSPQDAVSGCGA